MKLLVIGGGQFVGRHVVATAVGRGHEVTVFNRGLTGPGAVPGVEEIRGDRTTDLQRLSGRSWDAVVDACGYLPGVVQQSADALAGAVATYCFISSISVYDEEALLAEGSSAHDEDSPLARLADPTVTEVTGESYGGLKVLCEEVVRDAFGDRALILRPGLVVGPLDHTDRFTWWVHRADLGGEMLYPQGALGQWIDARDFADFTVHALESSTAGTFNVVAPPVGFEDLVAACLDGAQLPGSSTAVAEDFLLSEEVAPWTELPVWIPSSENSLADASRAVAAGLRTRSVHDTVADTRVWSRARDPQARKPFLSSAVEADLLRKWHARGG